MLENLKSSISSALDGIKGYCVVLLSILSAVLFLLYRREQSRSAEAESKAVVGERKGELNEIQKQTKQAEEKAADSRADYERLAAEHRESSKD